MAEDNHPQSGGQSEKYIVVGYTNDQEGQNIRERNIVRANNGRFYTKEETTMFRYKSAARCPTYGNCNGCYASGPAAKHATTKIVVTKLYF